MAYPKNHAHLTFGGRHFTTDTWSCGLRLWASWMDDATLSDLHTACGGALSDLASMVETMFVASSNQSASYLDWVKLNAVDTAGHQPTGAITNRFDLTAPVNGTVANGPPQQCMVASLRTAVARGRAHAGRIYLPTGQASFSAAGNVTTSGMVSDIAHAVANMITAINASEAWLVDPGPVAVTAPGVFIMSKIGAGAMALVNAVRVGKVMDTQRRRRAQLPENFEAPVGVT